MSNSNESFRSIREILRHNLLIKTVEQMGYRVSHCSSCRTEGYTYDGVLNTRRTCTTCNGLGHSIRRVEE